MHGTEVRAQDGARTEEHDRAVDVQDEATTAQPPAESRTAEEGRQAWVRALRAALPVWAVAYLGYVAVTYFAWFDPAKGPGFSRLLHTWRRYDATWFAEIVSHGYDNPERYSAPAFFPLYPALGWVTERVLPVGPATALQLVSAVCLLGMLVVGFRLVDVEFGAETAGRTIWLLMLFPSAFFLALGYNESLFIALMLGSAYAMRRGHWWVAGALGGLACLTRSIGIVLCLAFAFEYLRQRGFSVRRIRFDVLAGGLIPAGLGTYMLYLWAVIGDPFAFTTRMTLWGRAVNWPWTGIVQTFELMAGRPLVDNDSLHMVLDLAAVVSVTALLVLGLVGPWRMRRDQMLLPLLGLALVLFSVTFPPALNRAEPLMGAARYLLEAFPAFIVLARIRAVERPYTFGALLLQGVLLAHFVRGGWVA